MKITKLARRVVDEKTQEEIYQVLQHLNAACQTLGSIQYDNMTQYTSEYTSDEIAQIQAINKELMSLYTRTTNLYNPKRKS